MRSELHWRPIAGFIGLDLITYLVLYLLVLPPLEPAARAADPILMEATSYVLTAVRIGFIGAIVARWVRTKHGLMTRSEAIPTIVVAAGLSWLIQMALNFFIDLAMGGLAWDWAYLLALLQWVSFGLVGALFVSPGPSESEDDVIPLRFSARSERGAASLFLVPTIAILVGASLAVIVIMGSATNSRRAADTAADAAALAAGKVWKDTLHGKFSAALSAGDGHDFWGLVGTSLSYGLPYNAMQSAASDYAQRNDSEVVGFSVDERRAAVTVQVRHASDSTGETEYRTSMAESSLAFHSGLCNEWGTIGYKIDGVCVTSSPEDEAEDDSNDESDGEDPGDDEEDESFELPTGLSDWNVSVVLTDAG